ncbi:endolytic transglycosylase MltG [Corynebacterium sp. 320]|uniref:Endolytic murein transglycosylase n=1 Tax=Corynebacterium zhongnanshanii TaxID=2768834 RepID=A0ABQ6VGJ3_9CORY|nr:MULTISPECIES: endolytic transglycosylase MltG [Corynebacterium]KAB1503711.1 endolytic transglycosylase MltG [Corynebacterium sp. 320]KAB1553188.1 endolytic transglycosylase MltG [Corynebacterium sp. 321]KAB1553593.1 endolytic transglycosylase MltG [Corynebacterium sp. 319]KAB3523438.1 endolytic transglycosylase MltG [Corynebacterium zhongnanshanii]KAB3527847.1 endolytic transglycosylase MltG [Corynebacterium sp. 250]
MSPTSSVKPKYRRRRQHAAALAIALVILLVVCSGFVYYKRNVVGNRDFEGSGNGTTVMVRVEPGDSISSIASDLVDKKVVGSRRALMNAADKDQPNLQAGYYAMQEEMSASSALAALGDETRRRGVVDIPNGLTLDDVTVVNGETRKGIYSLISEQTCQDEHTCISPDELREAVTSTSPEDLGVPSWAVQAVSAHDNDPRRIEGLIVPGIHLFDPTSDAKSIMTSILKVSAENIEKTGIQQAAATVGLKPYEMLTAASLVEREAPEGDFDKVARVILNRLNEDMKLEFDSTVNYGLDAQEVATTTADRQRETPWNTYAKKGLPDTPIASPGIQALHAIENPAEGDWLYFVTIDKNGTTVFNREFDDHQNATAESIRNGVLDSNR